MTAQPSLTWQVSGPGTISNAGVYTAPAVIGGSSVRAVSGSIASDYRNLEINPAGAQTMTTAATASPQTVTGTTCTLSALASDDGGAGALTYTWSVQSGTPSVVTYSINGTNAAKSTVATFSSAGPYVMRVTVRDAQNHTAISETVVTVKPTASTAITVSPASAGTFPLGLVQLRASSTDQFGKSMTDGFFWTSTGAAIFLNQNGGVLAGQTPGTATVTAASGAFSGPATLIIYSPAMASLARGIDQGLPERASSLIIPAPFDAAAWRANPAGYLNQIEPGRVWQCAVPGAGVPALVPTGSSFIAASAPPITLSVRGAPSAPCTFAALDGGSFANGIGTSTVQADASGIATVIYAPPARFTECRVMVGSPLASGRVTFRITP